MRALLVDDEPLAIRRLARSLEQMEGVIVVGATTSPREAVSMIANEAPDIVFLDVAMPGLDGFEVVERIASDRPPAVVFVTAFDSHAVRAFDVAAADYLMKPFGLPRLAEAIERARLWLAARSVPSRQPVDALWVHRHREIVRVPVEDIDWIEGHGDYARIHGADFVALARATLTSLEATLDPSGFIRVHRSAICRKAAIVALKRRPTGAMIVVLANGEEVPVGRSFVPSLRALLKAVGS